MKDQTLWTSLEAAVITGGKNTEEWRATGVSINMYEIQPGDLFFASPDDNLDEVFARGAAAAVVSSGAEEKEGRPLLRVADVFEALQGMGRAARFRTHAFMIAVQGQESRSGIARILRPAFDIYTAGRHLSLSLAGMPELCDFAVFGFSPFARPDIAVITDCKNVAARMFEGMPASGRVLINSDSESVGEVIAEARAAGIRNIFTYGRSADADAVLLDVLHAGNGVRVKMKVMGEIVETVLPAGEAVRPETLAAALIMKLSEMPVTHIAAVLGRQQAPVRQNVNNLALMDWALKAPVEAAFRVMNIIDLGCGRRTAVLDNAGPGGKLVSLSNKELDIPLKIDNLELVYACKGLSLLANAESALQKMRPSASLERIVPEVLVPGDFITFKEILGNGNLGKDLASGSRNLISGALRFIPSGKKFMKAGHAL